MPYQSPNGDSLKLGEILNIYCNYIRLGLLNIYGISDSLDSEILNTELLNS